MIEDLFILFVGHCIGDYPLQSDFLATNKSKNLYILAVHCAIYTAAIMVALFFVNNRDATYQHQELAIGIIFITHFIIDKWKCVKMDYFINKAKIKNEQCEDIKLSLFTIDQVLHNLINFGIYFLL